MKVHTINGTCYVKCIDVNTLEQDLEATERQVCILNDGLSKCEKEKERIKQKNKGLADECRLISNLSASQDRLLDKLEKELGELELQNAALLNLARRCLWAAYSYNDNNSQKRPEEYCRDEAKKCGIYNSEDANLFLGKIGTQSLEKIQGKAIKKAVSDAEIVTITSARICSFSDLTTYLNNYADQLINK